MPVFGTLNIYTNNIPRITLHIWCKNYILYTSWDLWPKNFNRKISFWKTTLLDHYLMIFINQCQNALLYARLKITRHKVFNAIIHLINIFQAKMDSFSSYQSGGDSGSKLQKFSYNIGSNIQKISQNGKNFLAFFLS